MAQLETLLDLLATHGGRIISTGSMDAMDLYQAKESDRIHVDENGFGFAWDPDISDFPATDEEMEFFDKWHPVDNIEVPEGMFERIIEKINNTFNCDLPGYDLIGCPLINTDCKTCKYNVKS